MPSVPFFLSSSGRVLVGSGRACFETLRPLAYSLLAELIHHVRLELTSTMVRKHPPLLWEGDVDKWGGG